MYTKSFKSNQISGIRYACKLKTAQLRIVFIILLIPFFRREPALAQESAIPSVSEYHNQFIKETGPDENLINGHQYFNLYPWAKGHAFLGENAYMSGKIVIRGIEYNNVLLKYDILNQDVLLSYYNLSGNINQLVLRKNFISEFHINDKRFKKLYFDETGTQFFQVLSNDYIGCLYYWEKTLVNSSSLNSYYDYSRESKKTYIVLHGKLLEYKKNHSFIKLFDEEFQTNIKKFLRKNKIKVYTATDESIRELILYCKDLINS